MHNFSCISRLAYKLIFFIFIYWNNSIDPVRSQCALLDVELVRQYLEHAYGNKSYNNQEESIKLHIIQGGSNMTGTICV